MSELIFKMSELIFKMSELIFKMSELIFKMSELIFQISGIIFKIMEIISKINEPHRDFFHDNTCHPILDIKHQCIYNTMYNKTNMLTLSFTLQLG